MEPAIKLIFGFHRDMDPNSDQNMKSTRFIKHSSFFIQMIDKALGMLGPDIEVLTGILLELGEKHIAYGVKPEYFPSMGRALIDTLGEELDSDYFTEDVKSDWIEVYGALSYDMIRAQKLVKERDMKEEAEEKSVQEEAEKIVKERRHSSPADVVIRKD